MQILGDGRPGGGTTVVLSLSRLLASRGEEVVIITQIGSHLAGLASAAGFQIVGLDFSRRRRAMLLAAEIAGFLRRFRPMVTHAHGARAGLPAALIPRHRLQRFIYTIHGFHFLQKRFALYALARAAEAVCIARADCTVFVSDADRATAANCHLLGRSRAHRVIKNAVRVEAAVAGVRRDYDIAFLGRLHAQKNPLILVDILRAMQPARPNLLVIGGGELAGELAARMKQAGLCRQVRLCGECDRERAIELLSSCRVLVLPSRWEGHPLALIEAMHLGVPVVASDIPGNREIVVDGQTGYLVPVDDASAYAKRLTCLLKDVPLRQRMTADAQRRAAREYAVDRLLDAYLEVYGAPVTPCPQSFKGTPV